MSYKCVEAEEWFFNSRLQHLFSLPMMKTWSLKAGNSKEEDTESDTQNCKETKKHKDLMTLTQATQNENHQAASQLVFTCTVAAICCKSSRSIHSNVKGLANRWQQPRLQPRDLAPSSNQRCKKQPSS